MASYGPELIQIMRAVLDEVMTKIPVEQVTPGVKAHMAALILKAAAAGQTSYDGLLASASDQIQTILSLLSRSQRLPRFPTRYPASDGAWIGAGGQTRALFDDPQPTQDLAEIDSPPDPDAFGRKQAVVLRIPHALVPVFPIPTDWHSRPSSLRIVGRAWFWMSHNGAPKTAMLLITLPVTGTCMISSCVLQALLPNQRMLRSSLARRRKARHHDAAIATRVVRYSARDLLSQRRLLESLAHCHAGRGARRRRAQGAALADRAGPSRRPIRTRAARGGAADQRRYRRRRVNFVRELRRGGRGQARNRAGAFARAGAGERSFLGGAGVDDPRAVRAVHRRGHAAARRRGLDRGGACRDRAARRARRRACLDLVRALVRRRSGGYGPRCRGVAQARGDAAGRCHPRRRRDADRRARPRSRLPRFPHLQVAAGAVRARLSLRRQASPERRAAGADELRPPRHQLRAGELLSRYRIRRRRASLRHGRARSFHLAGDGVDRNGDDGAVGL